MLKAWLAITILLITLGSPLLADGKIAGDRKEIDAKLAANKSRLDRLKKEKQSLSNKVDNLGNEINKSQARMRRLQVKIDALSQNIDANKEKSAHNAELLERSRMKLVELNEKKEKIRSALISLIAQNIGMSYILEAKTMQSRDDIVLEQIFKIVNNKSKGALDTLSEAEVATSSKIEALKSSIKTLSSIIMTQKDRQDELLKATRAQAKLVANLKDKIRVYNARLRANDRARSNVDNILEKLNILRRDSATKKEREDSIARREELAKRKENNILDDSAALNVRQVASSYRQIATLRYHGPKTIAPLKHYKLVQRYGDYFDPVYKMKIFNEAVLLAPRRENAMVRNILAGRVVYAKYTPILKNIVVIENANGLHTIYAQMDKIAPTIKVGANIKKGYIIGRVSTHLSFEVTKKDKHIDPMDLIR